MTAEIEGFVREAARKRGIDPDIVVRAFKTEGGVDEYARLGDFSGPPWFSGKSWYPPQLHYGGLDPADYGAKRRDYRAWGRTAGMGNHFTYLTGWEPGDPRAWRDAVRYALNRVKTGGWSPWYGPATIDITDFVGVDRDAPWDANSERWDYEDGITPMPTTKVTFDPNYPTVIQNDDWSCAPTALTWAMRALGRMPATDWIEADMVALGLVTHAQGLMNHTGAGIVTWLQINDAQHYGADGYGISNNQNPISWDQLVPEINPNPPYPLLLGLPNWGGQGKGHWSGVRGFKDGRILLANPDNGPTFGVDSLTREQFETKAGGNASIVRVLHPDLLEATAPTPPPPPPVRPVTRQDLENLLVEARAQVSRIEALRDRMTA